MIHSFLPKFFDERKSAVSQQRREPERESERAVHEANTEEKIRANAIQSFNIRGRIDDFDKRVIAEDTWGFDVTDREAVLQNNLNSEGETVSYFIQKEEIKKFAKLEMKQGAIVYLDLISLPCYFDGYHGKYWKVIKIEKDNSFKVYYFPKSSISVEPPEIFWMGKRGKRGNTGEWWDLQIDEKVVLHKAVELYPGQESKTLTFPIKSKIDYHFYIADDVGYIAWINDERIIVGRERNIRGPHLQVAGKVKVQLARDTNEKKTIRFMVERKD